MSYCYVCPTCGSPLALTEAPRRGLRRPQVGTPLVATCPECDVLDRGPLSEKRIRREWIGIPVAACCYAAIALAGAWVLSRYGPQDSQMATAATIWVALWTVAFIVAVVLTLARLAKARRVMAGWRPYRRNGDAPASVRHPRSA
jgi:hypothetical protein